MELRSYDLEDRAQASELAIKRIKFWVQTALGVTSAVAIGTFAIAKWMSGVAHKDEVQVVATKMIIIETKVDLMTRMMELQADQSEKIARAVKAPLVVQPEQIRLLPPVMPTPEVKK